MPVAYLRHRQEPPAQRLVLRIVLAERQRRDGFGHFITQIERMRRIEFRIVPAHLLEENERIGPMNVCRSVDDVNFAAFDEYAVVPVGYPPGQFA